MILLLACLLIPVKAIPLCEEGGVNVPCTASSYVPTGVSKIVGSISNRFTSEGSENGASSTEIRVTSNPGPDVSTKPFSTTHVFTDTSPFTKVAAKTSLVTKNAANSSLVTTVAANSSLVTKVAAKISLVRSDEVNVPLVNTSAIHIGFLNRLNVQHLNPIKRNLKIPHFFTNWPHQNMGDIYMKSKPMSDFRKHKKTDKFRYIDIATKTPIESHWTPPWYPDSFTWYDYHRYTSPKDLGNTENMVYERLGQEEFPSLNSIFEHDAIVADTSEWMDKVSAKIRQAFRKCQMMSKRFRQNVELCNDMQDYQEDENKNDDEWLLLNSIPVKEMLLKRQTILPINFGLMFHYDEDTEEATTKPVPKVDKERKNDTGLYLLIIIGPSAFILFISVLVACIYSKKSVRKTSSKKKAIPAKEHNSLNLNQMANRQEKNKVENIYSNFSA